MHGHTSKLEDGDEKAGAGIRLRGLDKRGSPNHISDVNVNTVDACTALGCTQGPGRLANRHTRIEVDGTKQKMTQRGRKVLCDENQLGYRHRGRSSNDGEGSRGFLSFAIDRNAANDGARGVVGGDRRLEITFNS